MCDIFCVICTSASYSNIWFPFMWWHFSITTGPLSRDASRHRSSVRISLSAVYENTCKQINQMGINYYIYIFGRTILLSRFLISFMLHLNLFEQLPFNFTTFLPGCHPFHDSWRSQPFHSLYGPCYPHTDLSQHFWSNNIKGQSLRIS